MRPSRHEIQGLLRLMRQYFKYNRDAMSRLERARHLGMFNKLNYLFMNYMTASTTRLVIAYREARAFMEQQAASFQDN